MKLISLLENTTARPDIQTRHGLSLYLETKQHKILFDFGPDDSFARNAELLGVDLSAVDLAVLSHGHDDHGGGLRTFLEINHTAPVYIRSSAFAPHWSERGFIGLEPELNGHPQVYLTGTHTEIDSNLQLLSGITGRKFFASSNKELYMSNPSGTRIPDDFSHEQSLIVQEEGRCVLIAGCAHCGIVNILEQAEAVTGRAMTHVISGFHLCQPSKHTNEPAGTVRAIAAELALRPSRYFTCHCTGIPSYEILHRETGGQVQYLSGGSIVTL
ncbi:MAG: MBL fold metallo-hydrolase [Eubacteriales bacterium]|nr:MBL fold metallo-hydrolase [Eubacteriales bacterium]